MAVLSASRLPLVERDQAPLKVRGVYPPNRDASNVTKCLAGSPDTLALLAPLLGQLMNPTTLDLQTKEVVVLRVSAANRCAYCVPTHEVVARGAGLDAATIAALAEPGALDEGLGSRIRVLAEYCDQLVDDPNRVGDDLLTAMREHFAEHEIVELTVLAGLITTLNYVASVAALPLDPWTVAAR